jgi:hypothetical protein
MKRIIAYTLIFIASITITLLLTLRSQPSPTSYTTSYQQHTTKMTLEDQALWYSGKPSTHRVAAPAGIDNAQLQSASITINYLSGVDPFFGKYCEPWPSETKASFAYAARIWETLIDSSVPIVIDACWAELDHLAILGSSASSNHFQNFDGAKRNDTWYPVSLANALAKTDLDPTGPDMHIIYNKSWHDNGQFYYGTDGNPANTQIDFASVVLHEITHGLGFSGSMRVSGTSGSWGGGQPKSNPFIFEVFAQDADGQRLINTATFPNPSQQLAQVLTGGNVYFNGLNASSANEGFFPKLYAPSPWSQGSSFAHLDEIFNETEHALMTWAIDSGAAIHHPGSITLGILKDIGWTVSSDIQPKTNPSLTISPITAPAGTTFSFTGSNFTPDESITLWITDGEGNRTDLPAAQADRTGQFQHTWESTTTHLPGTYTLSAAGKQSRQTVTKTFTLTESVTTPDVPTLIVEPSSGPIGTYFIYKGSAFTPGEIVSCWLIDELGNRYNGPDLVANNSGNISSGWHVEAGDPYGTYTSYARGNQSEQTVNATFTVTDSADSPVAPTVSVSPVTATPSTVFIYTGAAFTPGEKVSLTLQSQGGSSTTLSPMVADDQGAFTGEIPLAFSETPGTYSLLAIGDQSQQTTRFSFASIPNTSMEQRITYEGTYISVAAGVSGDVTLKITLGSEDISGSINFTNHKGDLPFCGANDFIGTRNDNKLSWQFASQDSDQGCGFDTGWLFSIDAALSDDNSSIIGTYQVQEQTGRFQVRRTYNVPDTGTNNSSSVLVQTNDNGIATVTLTAGTTPGEATIFGVTETLFNVTNITFEDTTSLSRMYLPMVIQQQVSKAQYASLATTSLAHNSNSLPDNLSPWQQGTSPKPATIGTVAQPSDMLLEAATERLPADGKSTTSIILLVLDTMGNPINDEIIRVETTAGTLSTQFTPSTGEETPESVVITGPDEGHPNSYYQFQATTTPDTLNDTMSYYWTPKPAIGQGKDHVYYMWETTGTKTVSVEAVNSAGIVVDSTTISITEDIAPIVTTPPTALVITGPTVAEINTSFTLTATVSPLDVTLPMSYTWMIDTYWDTLHNRDATQDQLTFSFDEVGEHIITVVAENAAGSVSQNVSVTIQDTAPISPYIKNGGFEDGQEHWEQKSANNLLLILNKNTHDVPIQPHTGNWLAWLGGTSNETSQISQQIRLPDSPSYLTFSFWLATKETQCDGIGDTFEFLIDGNVRGKMELCEITATESWAMMGGSAFDLSNYAGKTITVMFQVTTDDVSDTNSNFFIDDIVIHTGVPLAQAGAGARGERVVIPLIP